MCSKNEQWFFQGLSPDMKLVKTIQRSQTFSSGNIGQIKKTYVTEWELIYHDILAISNLHAELMNLKKHYAEHNFYHRELSGIDITEYEAANKVVDFILLRGNA